MALTERERRIVEKAADIISGDTPQVEEVEALRRIMRAKGMTLAEALNLAQGNEVVEELTRERNYYRRQAERLERQMAARMRPANLARTATAEDYAAEVAQIIQAIVRERPGATTNDIAGELERRKITTPAGLSEWSRMQVHRIMQRAGMRR